MNAVLVVAFAGMRKKRLQMAIFSVCSMLGAFFLLCALVLNFAMESSFDHTYKKLVAPNTVIGIQETDIAEEELHEFFQKLSYIDDYEISKSYLASQVKLPNRNMDFGFLASSKSKEIKSNTVIVNNALRDVSIGDQIRISVNGQEITLKIDSVIIDPVNSAPESMIPYFWMNEADLDNLTTGYDKGNYFIEANFEPADQAMARFVSDYEKVIGSPFEGTFTNYEEIKNSYLFRYEIFGEFFLFICIFLFVIIIIITVLLSQMAVYTDIKKLGTLKSFGVTNHQIRMSYILQYVGIALISSIIGVLVSGIMIQTWLSSMFSGIDSNLYQIKDLWFYQILVLLFINVTIFLVIQCSIFNIVRVTPLDALHSVRRYKIKRSKDVFLPSSKWIQLNLAMIKSLQRRLETLFVFILTIGITVLYMTCIFVINGVKNADTHLSDWGIVEMDIYVSRKTNVDEEKSGLLSSLRNDPAVDFYYAGLSDNVNYRLLDSGVIQSVVGEIYDKSIPDGLEYVFLEGRNPQQYDEVAVGMNFAKENKLLVGDRIIVLRNGTEKELKIVGIYPSFQQYANSIRFLTNDIQAFFGNQANGYYSIVLNHGEDVNSIAMNLSNTYSDFDFFPMVRNTVRSVNMLLAPMLVCIVLCGIIFLLLLLCIATIMIKECRGDLCIYRYIGFTLRRVSAIVRWRFYLPIAIAAILAIPLAIYVVPTWLTPLAQRLGLLEIPIYPNLTQIVIALFGVMGCCFFSVEISLYKMRKQIPPLSTTNHIKYKEK